VAKFIINVIKVNALREGMSKTGGKYRMQDCEVLVLNEDGEADRAGSLMLPKDYVEKVVPGHYEVELGLGLDRERNVVGRVVGLTRVDSF